MKTVNIKISCCILCPNMIENKVYTGDSFDNCIEWKCAFSQPIKTIAFVDTFDKYPSIPNWCPLSEVK